MNTSVMQRSRSHTAAKAYKKSVLPRWPHGNKAPIPQISADQFGPGHGKAQGSSQNLSHRLDETIERELELLSDHNSKA